MIQRIQSIYLLLVVLLGALLPFWLELWVDAAGGVVFAKNEIAVSLAFYGSALLAAFAIFRYKDRKSQFVLNRLNMLIESFFTRIFRLPITKSIRRDPGLGEGYWDADSCSFYRFSGPGQQGYQEG